MYINSRVGTVLLLLSVYHGGAPFVKAHPRFR